MIKHFGQHSDKSWAHQPTSTFTAVLAESLFMECIVKEIPLTQGKVALVDDEDYEELNKHKWCAQKTGKAFYAVRNVGKRPHQKHVYMHRQILNAPPGVECDHRNGNGLDNRRCNLRICTSGQNKMNQRPRGGTSQFKGVRWHRQAKRWQAEIMINSKHRYLGLFADETDAARTYDVAARELFGEFARTNFEAIGEQSNA